MEIISSYGIMIIIIIWVFTRTQYHIFNVNGSNRECGELFVSLYTHTHTRLQVGRSVGMNEKEHSWRYVEMERHFPLCIFSGFYRG